MKSVDTPYIESVHIESNDTAYLGWSTGALARVLWRYDDTLSNIRANSRPETKVIDERVLEDKEKFPFSI